ncbi:MAG TPA: hypothetical protein VKS25_04665 [Solirubrobacteraceae bacterium]|nr:hypothetical protein [Solirubrobacteraceae bacterium]
MSQERRARIALRAYPRELRASRGEEMIATLLDASGESGRRHRRELAGLVVGGLRARALRRSQPGPTRNVADGLCYAATGMLALASAEIAGVDNRFASHWVELWPLALLGGALAAALAGYDRIAALAGLAWIIDAFARVTTPQSGSLLAFDVVPLVCLLTMLVLPRREPRRLARLVWLIPIAAFGILAGGAGPRSYLLLTPLAVVVPLAVARFQRDPRLAIACALFAWQVGMFELAEAVDGRPLPLGLLPTALLFGTAPVVFALARQQARFRQRDETV